MAKFCFTVTFFLIGVHVSATDYALLERHWKIETEKTIELIDPENALKTEMRTNIQNAMRGTELIFNGGFIERILPSGKRAGPAIYTIRPINDDSFEISSDQLDIFLTVVRLNEQQLCIRYDAPEPNYKGTTLVSFECYIPAVDDQAHTVISVFQNATRLHDWGVIVEASEIAGFKSALGEHPIVLNVSDCANPKYVESIRTMLAELSLGIHKTTTFGEFPRCLDIELEFR